MKISFIAENDFANVLTEYSYCLNKHSQDIKSKSICFRPHPFNYNIPHDYDLEKSNESQKIEAKKWIEESDVIIFGEEGHPLEPTYRTLKEFSNLLGLDIINSNKKLCIWHPGTHYRQNYNFYNNHPLKNKIYKHFYAVDLYRLSTKQNNDWPLHTYQYNNFNYNKFIEKFKLKLNKRPWTILHIPSNTGRKGTSYINDSILKLNLDPTQFIYKTLSNIPHSQVIQEKENSLFYIDQFNIEGCYGVAAIESLFKSNFTFSVMHNTSEALYKLTGDYISPIVPLNFDINSLESNLEHYILNTTESMLLEYMEGIGKWLEEQYSPLNIVEFFKKLLNE